MSEATCCRFVSGSGGYTRVCSKRAKVERDGSHYCGMHDPQRTIDRDAERAARRDREDAVRSALWDMRDAERKVLNAAIAHAASADPVPAIAAAVKALDEAIDAHERAKARAA